MNESNAADTAWILFATALVLLMTPGLALFYGGMVRGKNVLSTFMHSFFALGLMTLQWIVVGYSLAYAPDIGGGIIGGFDHVLLDGVGLAPSAVAPNIPHLAFMAFQMMFAIITPALISGAFAERLRFSTYCVFIVLWGTLVYDPICHWVWGPQGWLAERGMLDFAGGTVVHLSAGVSALVFALVLGRRLAPTPPHNLPLTLVGAGLLWFGWFGFNAGSALAANERAVLALVNTHAAAAAAAVSWASVEWIRQRKPTALGVASGLVAGLVAITPAAGFVSPLGALAIGALTGPVCFFAVLMKSRLGYDDSLDAFGIHGVGGALGAVLTGVFASAAWNSPPDAASGIHGLLEGNSAVLVEQLSGVMLCAAYSAIVTWVILKVLDGLIGLRVPEDAEREGLDVSLHGEEAYHVGQATALTGAD
ncbi:MAG TPA: ammonium transporter [Polyangiaceae bacterium]|nr:ammonium transporter [Polyangiaceae bacterium]